MIFTPDNAQKVMDGRKTMTRRIVKDGENATRWDGIIVEVCNNDRHKWGLENTYAVCPGRGKKAVGRIRITAIRREKLQDISEADAAAELGETLGAGGRGMLARFEYLWNHIYRKQLGKQWADNPDVWVLTFEVVK